MVLWLQVFVSELTKVTTRPGVTGCGPGVVLLGGAAVAVAAAAASASPTSSDLQRTHK